MDCGEVYMKPIGSLVSFVVSLAFFKFSDENGTYKLLLSGHPWKKELFEPSGEV